MLFNLHSLKNKYNFIIHGIIHIGAHYGEEYFDYINLGIKNLVFFEPLESNYNVLITKVPRQLCHKVALGQIQGNIDMFVEEANQGQSSSILEPDLHLQQYPNIIFNKKENVKITTLDSYNYGPEFNMINIDVQGYELEVLRGASSTLKNIDYIYTEVNRAEVYKNCCKVEELDQFLKGYGFSRIETSWEGRTWGDAIYAKNISI